MTPTPPAMTEAQRRVYEAMEPGKLIPIVELLGIGREERGRCLGFRTLKKLRDMGLIEELELRKWRAEDDFYVIEERLYRRPDPARAEEGTKVD